MDQERERIQEDLRGMVDCEVRCDDVFVQMYASDASIYQIRPLGVVRPRGVKDVVKVVQYAAEHEIPIHARGAGTGLSGESIGAGLVLDFSHSMRRVLRTDEDTVTVQPGVVLAQLNSHLANHGRIYGPDPATRSVTTMGSVVSLDASGSHWLKYGSARGTVERLEIVTADGEVLEVGKQSIPSASKHNSNSRLDTLVRRLSDLLQRRADVINEHRPQSLVNRSGYHLYDVLNDGHLDLARLLVGSEGTLALITEMTLRTERMSNARGVALLFFDRLDGAARASLEVAKMGIAACDLMDRRLLSIAQDLDVRFDVLIPQQAEAMLLVEQSGDSEVEVRDQLQKIVHRLHRRKRMAFDSRITLDLDERNLFWRLTRRVIPTLYQLKGSTRALPFIEDVAVPPESLPDFLVDLQNTFKKHQVTASTFAHAGHGQLHIRPFLDLGSDNDMRTMESLANELYEKVLEIGGTISGEHGDGLSRTWFVKRQFGPLYDVFRDVKRIFDPQNILNPGKVVADAPQSLAQNLRPVSSQGQIAAPDELDSEAATDSETRVVELQLVWKDADVGYAARSCNGCGRCRTQSREERMCPIFRIAPAEEASPRAKANLMRGVLTGKLDASTMQTDEFKLLADLCVNCHQCRLECPASVDIPKLMVEAKAQYVGTNGLGSGDWYFTRLDSLSSWGSLISPVANWAIRNRTMRWVIEKMFGIAQGRKLPRFASRSFMRLASRRRLTRPTRRTGRKVLYFVDNYANWHDAQLAEALVAVLEHNGVAVYVHPKQMSSGMSMISTGLLDRAKKVAAHNTSLLAEAVRQGYHIVATEPAAALCLKHEYLNLLDDEDAQLVADNSSEACHYLWRMHQSGRLELNFKPINMTFGYHTPCHIRALASGSPGENLLRLVPGLKVSQIEKGCSGMAGTFGLKRKNYRASLRAGWGLISALREQSIQLGATECSSCKIQMEQGTTKPTMHPLKVLALAYGLMSELESHLTAKGEELIVT